MKWVVIELQTMEGGAVANIVTVYDNKAQAESAWHMIMGAAALSNLPVHSAVMIDNYGSVIMNGSFPDRPQEAETI